MDKHKVIVKFEININRKKKKTIIQNDIFKKCLK